MIGYLLLAVLLVVLLALVYGPLESLGWWQGKGADGLPEEARQLMSTPAAEEKPPYEHYVIYLSGIGAIDPTSIPPEELPLTDDLRSRLPTFCVARDVFPYSVSNRGLTAQRAFAGLWRRVEKMRLKNPDGTLGMLVNARNAIQLFVCADRRYGPTYNIGTAREIFRSLQRNGYQIGSGVPVTLIGWSGGAQIAIGACSYLGMAGIPVSVISIGGMFADDPGMDRLQHLTHLRGTNDPLEKLGSILFAGRWPRAVGSPWTRAKDDGRVDEITLGPMTHNGKGNYFDAETIAPDGRNYLQVSGDALYAILTGGEVKVVEEPPPSG